MLASLVWLLGLALAACGSDEPPPYSSSTPAAGRNADRDRDEQEPDQEREPKPTEEDAPKRDAAVERDAAEPDDAPDPDDVRPTVNEVGCTSQCFEAPRIQALAFAGFDLALADFDEDGALDIAVVGSDGLNSIVSVLLSEGDGHVAQSPIVVGDDARAIAAGDLDGDGHADLATANYGPSANSASVLFGDGKGGFAEPITVAAPGRPFDVAIGRLDDDRAAELLLLCSDGAELRVAYGSNDRELRADDVHAVGPFPTRVCVGDASGDGKLDAVVGHEFDGETDVRIFVGAEGTLRPANVVSTGNATAWGCAIGDFDGDGVPDIASVVREIEFVRTLLGRAGSFVDEGGYSVPYELDLPERPTDVVSADFNDDGYDDLAVTLEGGLAVRMLYGGPELMSTASGQTLFTAEEIYLDRPVGIAAGDLDQDGLPDLAVLTAKPSVALIMSR